MKVRFIHVNNKIIAVTKYAGDVIRASAKCNPEDEFNAAFGEKLAEARLKVKLAKRRKTWAEKQRKKALEKCIQATNTLNKMSAYSIDTNVEYKEAVNNLKKLEEKI